MSEQLTASGITDEMRTPCEVWSRVMGYHRPTYSWNLGKQGEFEERVCFEEQAECRT